MSDITGIVIIIIVCVIHIAIAVTGYFRYKFGYVLPPLPRRPSIIICLFEPSDETWKSYYRAYEAYYNNFGKVINEQVESTKTINSERQSNPVS